MAVQRLTIRGIVRMVGGQWPGDIERLALQFIQAEAADARVDGSPEPGVWITPRTDREAEALGVLKELGLADDAMFFTAAYGAVGSEAAMVSRAWDLSEVEERYEAFIDEFTGLRPADGDAVLQAQTMLVHEWRRFPFLDPRLPLKLLPANWSGAQAADLFHGRHAEWGPVALRRWEELVDGRSGG
ncbi:PaaX family transcriptional regulator C-terminal domain-containing protein [Streptomyces cavernae]|uniref:PaaX family transcriptional regulator C-terminal domain-containing protein n=1 Tax=Streptomyces cavernae TaxID=2259034 RepID=UPI001EE4BCB3|nr:PaaX family transcriptional regulator C-terminal domain-containing protein [Streptomyces cavernae]